MEEKCLLLIRVQNLEEGSLVKMIGHEDECNGWPCLGKEVQQICQEIKISDIISLSIHKAKFQKAIQFLHVGHIIEIEIIDC